MKSFREGFTTFKLQTSAAKTIAHTKSNISDGKVTKRRRSGGKHQMAACCACKKKRKRCDDNYPKCSTCASLGIDCTIIDPFTKRQLPRNYLEVMEQTISSLKSQLGNKEFDNTEDGRGLSPSYNGTNSYPSSTESSLNLSSSEEDLTERYPPTVKLDKDLEFEVGYVSLGPDSQPRFIGSTSAYSLAKVISHAINNYSVYRGNKTNIILSNFDRSYNTPNSSSASHMQCPAFVKPSLSVAKRYLHAYQQSVQCQYPFLEWDWVLNCFEEVMKSGETVSGECNFFMYMIFAIGSQVLNSQESGASYTQMYYQKASETVGPLIERDNLTTVQVYLLMNVISQKLADGISTWQTTGLAIRTSIALGLHRMPYKSRKLNLENTESKLEELKLRIFWSAYGMERLNSLVLGRPFCISDVDIDAPFPKETEEISIACRVIKLRRIQSNIYTFIYQHSQLQEEEEESTDNTRVQIVLELNEWVSHFPFKRDAQSTFETSYWSSISYHNSMLLLLRPVIVHISKDKEKCSARHLEWFKIFADSASKICLNYKDIHNKNKVNYSWHTLHCCFVSGISFLYCAWLNASLNVIEWNRKSIVYDTIAACSTVLYVLADKWPQAKIFRDSFERLAKAIISILNNEDGDIVDQERDQCSNVLKDVSFVSRSMGIQDLTVRTADNDTNDNDNSKHNSDVNIPLSTLLESELRTARKRGFNAPEGYNFSMPLELDDTDISTSMSTEDFDASIWEFLDSTGDNLLRRLFQQMEDELKF